MNTRLLDIGPAIGHKPRSAFHDFVDGKPIGPQPAVCALSVVFLTEGYLSLDICLYRV